MYQIKVIDSNAPITVLCPSPTSVQECIYRRLIQAMRQDIAMSVKCNTMREIVSFYATQFAQLDNFDRDETERVAATFETYNGSERFEVTCKNTPYYIAVE